MTDITMPRLSDSMEEGTILTWLKADGDPVAAGDELLEIETDKATVTHEAAEDGALAIAVPAGATVAVGTVIGRLLDPAEAGVEVQKPTAAAVPAAVPAAPAATAADGRPPATPVARRLARIHGVDLATVTGSGPRGRILRSDVAGRAGLDEPDRPPAPAPAPAAGSEPGGAKGRPEIREPTRLQQLVARRMAAVKATVPDFQVQTDVEMDALLALRAALRADGVESVPSINDFVVRASALALREHPLANGAYVDGRFELYPRINIGIAVAAEGALVVPTITDADRRSLDAIAAEARRLAERVRSGAITPAELAGATFTVSNLGMYGMTAITPVINAPQAAILGVGASRTLPALQDGALVERHLMTLTLSCDHRILYGAEAAELLSDIRALLEHPLRLMV